MKKKLAIPVIAALSCALAIPAFAGGEHCSGKSSTAYASASGDRLP